MPARSFRRRSWRVPHGTFPVCENGMVEVAALSSFSPCSRSWEPCTVAPLWETPASPPSSAMVAPPRPPLTPAAHVPLFPLHLISASHIEIKGQKWPIPLRWRFYLRDPRFFGNRTRSPQFKWIPWFLIYFNSKMLSIYLQNCHFSKTLIKSSF
jgi:hypothetical protein